MKIYRKQEKHEWCYTVSENSKISGTSRYTLGFLFHNITVRSESGDTLCLRQTNFFLQILDNIPLIGWFVFVPFQAYVNGVYAGSSKRKYGAAMYTFPIGEDIYEMSLHNPNKAALLKNGKQIALYRRDDEIWLEQTVYRVQHSADAVPEILLLFAVFADQVLFSLSGSQVAVYRKERYYQLRDKHPERGNWKPEVDEK